MFIVRKARHRFVNHNCKYRAWLSECIKNRAEGKECTPFNLEESMKFLEESALNYLKLRKVCARTKEFIKNDENFQPEDMEIADLLNNETENFKNFRGTEDFKNVPETENLKNLSKTDAKVVEQQIQFPSIPSYFVDFSIDPSAEIYESVNVLQSFTSYKFLDQKKKLRFQHDFRKLIVNFEEEFLK